MQALSLGTFVFTLQIDGAVATVAWLGRITILSTALLDNNLTLKR
jgi:hypothetical protein